MDIQIVTGFLGAGKTTFLNKYLPSLPGKTVVIENEFGDVGIDGSLIPTEVPVHEIYAGCICCSLAMDFRKGIKEIADEYEPDHIVIEPSGVGRLSDILKACIIAREREKVDLEITKLIAVVDAEAFEDYLEGFGEFYSDQIRHARLVLLSNIEDITEEEKQTVIDKLKKHNPEAVIYDGDWRLLDEVEIKDLVDSISSYDEESDELTTPSLPADRVFSSMSIVNDLGITAEELESRLKKLGCQETYGYVLRAKGIVISVDGKRIHFDYTPYAQECKEVDGKDETGIAIIGCDLKKTAIEKLFEK